MGKKENGLSLMFSDKREIHKSRQQVVDQGQGTLGQGAMKSKFLNAERKTFDFFFILSR